MEDTTDIDFMKTQIVDLDIFLGEKTGMNAVISILQDTEVYFEQKLRQLDDYIWSKNYQNYKQFLDIIENQEFQNFINEVDEFKTLFNAFTGSSDESSEIRKQASLELNKWLRDHIDTNPFLYD